MVSNTSFKKGFQNTFSNCIRAVEPKFGTLIWKTEIHLHYIYAWTSKSTASKKHHMTKPDV